MPEQQETEVLGQQAPPVEETPYTNEDLQQAVDESTPTPTDTAPPGDEQPQDDGPISSDMAALGRSYGLSDEELGGYESEEALQSTLAVLDRQLLNQQQQPQPQQTQQAAPPQQAAPQFSLDPITLDLSDLPEDDQIRKSLEQLADQRNQVAQQIGQLHQTIHQQQQSAIDQQNQQLWTSFDGALDGEGMELYGQSASLTAQQSANRRAVSDVFAAFYTRSLQNGQAPNVNLLTRQAQQAVHGREIFSRDQTKKADAIRKRSGRRTFVGQTQAGNGEAPRSDKATEDHEFMSAVRERFGE